ncbi:MAG TPA: alpha/beta fold hydrolase [Thermoanaerobaculia bacterium]|nr:alpha/beta fold hydrolase [Thermoanaerobaculia bacterium]
MRPGAVILAVAAAVAAAPAAAQAPPRGSTAQEVVLLPAGVGADIARQVAAELKARDFPGLESRFDEGLKAALPDGALRLFWADTLTRAGAFRGCADPRMKTAGEFTLAFSECSFEKEKAELRLTMRPDGRLAGMFLAPSTFTRPDWTAPDYVNTSAFTERDVTVKDSMVSLPATLTLPREGAPFPGVVLVHGSGPQDRDETVGGTRVFQDLAQGLASRGIAVLRYEKRTKTYQKELAGTRDMTLRDEVLDDALAALALLRAAPGVDPARVYVLGHSLGGMLAPRIAQLDGKVAGLILLAAPSRPMSEVVRDQVAALSSPNATDTQKATAPALRREAEALADLYAGRLPASPGATILGAPPSYWLELKAQTPALTAASLGLPILVLQGGRDAQVSMKDFAGWQRDLKGVARASLKAYPRLNHLFVAGEGPSSAAEYERPGHVDREVVEDVATFAVRGSLRRPERKKK